MAKGKVFAGKETPAEEAREHHMLESVAREAMKRDLKKDRGRKLKRGKGRKIRRG
jgi:hypothetical protein